MLGGLRCATTGNPVGGMCRVIPAGGDPQQDIWSCVGCTKMIETTGAGLGDGAEDNSMNKLHKESFTTGGSDGFSVLIGGVSRSFKHIVFNSKALAKNPSSPASNGVRFLIDDELSIKICLKFMPVHGVVYLHPKKFAKSLFTKSFLCTSNPSKPPLLLVQILVGKSNNHPISLVVYNNIRRKLSFIDTAHLKTFMEEYICEPERAIPEDLFSIFTSLSEDFFLNGIPEEGIESILFSPAKMLKDGALKTSVCNLVNNNVNLLKL